MSFILSAGQSNLIAHLVLFKGSYIRTSDRISLPVPFVPIEGMEVLVAT